MLVGLGKSTHLLEIFLLRVQLLQHDFLRRIQLVEEHLEKTAGAVPEKARAELQMLRCASIATC